MMDLILLLESPQKITPGDDVLSDVQLFFFPGTNQGSFATNAIPGDDLWLILGRADAHRFFYN